jgi:hypothetical protein
MLDALDPRLLTTTVWQELFEIYQKQFSADLPFLHRISFLRPLRNMSTQHSGGSMSTSDAHDARPPGSDDFLLAFLALTARFHPRLVAHHSPPTASRPSNPLIASEYYANCANERQMALWPEQENHSNTVEGIQARLMLGLHDWGMCRGHRAWMRVGMCIRSAQSLGLQYEKDLDDEPNSRSFALNIEAERMGINTDRTNPSSVTTTEMDANIAQEVRRRTFWSCYIMDRYLSSGKYRPQMLFAPLLRTQLPASDRSFAFGEKVRTLMLNDLDGNGINRAEVQSHRQAMLNTGHQGEPAEALSPNSMQDDENEKGRLQAGADEGLLSRYIKILEIYGKVVQWSCAGGRRFVESMLTVSKKKIKNQKSKPIKNLTDDSLGPKSILRGIHALTTTSSYGRVRSSKPAFHETTHSLPKTFNRTSPSTSRLPTRWYTQSTCFAKSCSTESTCHSSRCDARSQRVLWIHLSSHPRNTTFPVGTGRTALSNVSRPLGTSSTWFEPVKSGTCSSNRPSSDSPFTRWLSWAFTASTSLGWIPEDKCAPNSWRTKAVLPSRAKALKQRANHSKSSARCDLGYTWLLVGSRP